MLRQGNSFESNSGTTKQFVFNLLGTILRGVDSLKENYFGWVMVFMNILFWSVS